MSLYDCRGRFANDKEMARRRSGAASRDIDAVIHKTHRQSYRRINQRFLYLFSEMRLYCSLQKQKKPAASQLPLKNGGLSLSGSEIKNSATIPCRRLLRSMYSVIFYAITSIIYSIVFTRLAC